jgi:DNA-directed RNA polymerase specialized sigma24 family protein
LIFREVEDRDLIAKARKGHVDAYNVLVSRWEKRVFNYLLRLVSNREDALDLSQDVFLKAYQNLKKLEDPALSFRAGCFASPITRRSRCCERTGRRAKLRAS